MKRSGARSGGSLSGNGAGSGGYRIRLERGAAFSPAPRSAPFTCSDYYTFSPDSDSEIIVKIG